MYKRQQNMKINMMKNIYNSLSQQKVGHPCSKAFLTKDWCAYMKETDNFEIWQKMR